MNGLVIDTSALISIINAEPEAVRFLEILVSADRLCMSTGTVHEVNCVLQRYRRDEGPELMSGLLGQLRPEIISFDIGQLEIARAAYVVFGRGAGHPAGLNMADCFSYALAKALDLPLLFKGNDFIHTDISPAI